MIQDSRLWHVIITVAGAPMEPLIVRAALHRLSEQRPFLSALRFSSGRAEITYWEEAPTLVDAASLALRLWNEYRETARLPSWDVVGLEVVERELKQNRDDDAWGDLHVVPQPF